MHYAASVEEEKLNKLPRDKPDTCTSSAFDFLLSVWITIAWLNSRHSAKYSIRFKDATENRELGGKRSEGEETRTRKGKCLGNVMKSRRLFSEAFHQNPKNRAKLTLLFFFFLHSHKESACNVGHAGLIPGLERSPGEENGNPLQYSCLEKSMDRGAW